MIKNVSIIGAGTMGQRIALVFAQHGLKVFLYDAFKATIEKAPEQIQNEFEFLAKEKYISESQIVSAMNHITFCSELEDAVKDADYVIEAIPENMELKKDLFLKLEKICPSHTVFATNTSSLKIQEMISDLPIYRQKLCMVCHWYNPAHLIPLVELSCFEGMDKNAFQEVYNLYTKAGKKPICVQKDVTGMVANRLSHSLAREVFHLIEEGVATAEDVEKALKFGVCFRYATSGILECADMGGLDIWCTTEDNIFPTLDNTDKAFGMMRDHVERGELGIKTGKGFFDYRGEDRTKVQEAFNKKLVVQLKASGCY